MAKLDFYPARRHRRWLHRQLASLTVLVLGLGASYLSVLIWPDISQMAADRPFGTPSVGGSLISERFAACSGSIRFNCVIDGDTIWARGEKVRLADIDTPEVFSPRCAQELARGLRASERLLQLLNQGPFTLETMGRAEDRYGRALRVAMRDGLSLGQILVGEGLARPWDGARHSWCA